MPLQRKNRNRNALRSSGKADQLMTRNKCSKKTTTSDLSAQSAALAQFAAESLVAAERLQVKRKRVLNFTLDVSDREMAAKLHGFPPH